MITITKPAPPTVYVGRCIVCGCEIECHKEDIIYEDRPCGTSYVNCPTPHCTGVICPHEKSTDRD